MASRTTEKKPLLLTIIDIAAIVSMGVAIWMAYFYAPRELVMGEVQRIFYFHAASGWIGMAALIGASLVGIIYLIRPHKKWDILAVAAVEVGLVYSLMNIVTGSIWARPAWNTWWTWDPRLVTATIMELTFLAYLLLRQSIEDPERRARFGAIYSILAALTVPLSFYSIRIWRTLHPVVIGSGSPTAEGGFDMTRPMLYTLLVMILAFTLFGISVIWHRVRLGWLQDKVEELRLKRMGA
jgi:heme exporter protein C